MNFIERQWFAAECPRVPQGVAKRPLRLKLYALLIALDLLCVVGGFMSGAMLRFGQVFPDWIGVTASVFALYSVAALLLGAYTLDVLRSPGTSAGRAGGALLLAFTLLFLLFYFLRVDRQISRAMIGFSFLLALLGIIVVRHTVGTWIVRTLPGGFTRDLVLVDGPAPRVDAPPGASMLSAPDLGLDPASREASMLVRFGQLVQGADRVIVLCGRSEACDWSRLLKGSGVRSEILTQEYGDIGPCGVGELNGHATLVVSTGSLDARQRLLKRVFDLCLTVPALFLLIPVGALIAVAIKLDSRGPVFFKQPRVGRGNALFDIYKFRTMVEAQTDLHGEVSVSRDDQRVTRIGRFLRRTSLDELPQLLNVLFGSMSIVGPRPHALASRAGNALFWHVDERYWDRHVLKPGITGLAQVRGLRGATDTREHLTSRLDSDLEYIAGWSIWRDVSILLGTVRVLVHPHAY